MNKIVQNLLILSLVISSITLYGQQDPHFTQYMFNTMSVNPAYVGSKGHGVINLLGRAQWVGVEGAPQTQTLSYDTPIGYSGVGLGINLVNDVIGPSRETYLDANVSYTVRTTDEANLAFGMKLGGRFFNIDWTKGIYRDKDDLQLASPINRFLPTIGAGVYYYTNNWYVGLAVPNILRTEHYDDVSGGGSVAVERMHYFFIAGYVFDLSESIKFKPALLTKVVSGAPLSLDVSANFLFNEKFRAGVAWRWDDSISALLGFQVSRSLQIGYAYDLTTSNYSNYNSGTHEVLLRYEMFRPQTVKSPRFF
ncbi:type IX secretion system membrane protein, PorP/SprF family [Tenacibaculum sp. MAR_2009_124]|uniref:PorP/SprF family type IX secretion system membrane protein n=1 Tax=Tenacibaculum sp. MAR_2009_124 TaxID=1250059 RepID=UPI0008981D30|nr:type IX secretion system membrane protein PorP/SprF [Tenacibaculum sp. MAR_2009_124]SEB54950.1 type IX secretion system membrane protein, PorP/SprF family [Tenacibaculum sp. MAR_2009_124]SEC03147.1 type IX secretion system membrane protein, PorP/SprF family [Tenacibaculum sp. MAR_2009_124]